MSALNDLDQHISQAKMEGLWNLPLIFNTFLMGPKNGFQGGFEYQRDGTMKILRNTFQRFEKL